MRQGKIEGQKVFVDGRWRWMIWMPSVRRYTNPSVMYEDSRAGPKTFLVKRQPDEDDTASDS
jgi:hypothetical protein